MPTENRSKISAYAASFAVVLIFVCAALSAEIILYSRNSIFLDGQWIVVKRTLKISETGADSFLLSRAPVAGNVLHLDKWFGFGEVFFKPTTRFREVDFRFKLDSGALIDVLYGPDPGRKTGIRLSLAADYPCSIFSVNQDGEFLSLTGTNCAISDTSWHDARLEFVAQRTTLWIDGRAVLQAPPPPSAAFRIGFRHGGKGAAVVDELKAEDTEGKSYADSFADTKGGFGLFGETIAVLTALSSAFTAWLILKREKRVWDALLGLDVTLLTFLTCGALYFAFDFAYWSRLELDPFARKKNAVEKVEWLRFRLFGGSATAQAEISDPGYPSERIFLGPVYCDGARADSCRVLSDSEAGKVVAGAKKGKRLLFAGGSQAFGVGADNLSETFVAKIHESVARSMEGTNVETMNISERGARVADLAAAMREKRYLEFNPDIVVFYISSQENPYSLREGLKLLKNELAARKIKCIFLVEPEAWKRSALAEKIRDDLVAAATKNAWRVYDLQSFLDSREIRLSGLLWRDYVHLSNFGQSVVALWLAPKVLESLPKN